jgi:hypothetical protein
MIAERPLSNAEVITLAVFLAGGDGRRADTEDVAVKANEIAPGRFVWRKYPDQINIHHVGAFLCDAKKEKYGRYLSGSLREGWALTEAGLAFARANLHRVQGLRPGRRRLGPHEERERRRMLASEALALFHRGGAAAVDRRQAEAFFRIDDYVTGESRRRKVGRLVALFESDPRLGPAVRELGDRVLSNGNP